ncbi:MAG: carboxypeptidase-like regulatory domain-containing protein [Gemmatimonas sp.]
MKLSLITFAVPFCLVATTTFAHAQDATARKPAPASAGVVGSVVPGGSVLSSALVTVTPVAGGTTKSAPIAGNGAFALTGLAPGRYRMALSTPKQTQGATFGEKVNQGLHAAGSAVAQGAKVNPNSMPSRLSMNVTIARKSLVLEIDGAPVEIEVGADGKLTGQVTAK